MESLHLDKRAHLCILEGQVEPPQLSGTQAPYLSFVTKPLWPVSTLLVSLEVHLPLQHSASLVLLRMSSHQGKACARFESV